MVVRPKRTVPFRTIKVTHELHTENLNWKSVEKKYGCPISDETRAKLLEATQRFIWDARSEETAEPQADTEAKLCKIKRAATRFQSALCEEFDSTDAGVYAKLIFKKKFPDRQLPPEADPINFSIELSTSVVVACHEALTSIKTLEAQELGGNGNLSPWRKWITRITRIAKDSKLSTSVRKDAHPGPEASAFLLLVRELQGCVPKEYRHKIEFVDGLAQAIHRARRKGRDTKSSK
jgi:hypothetical protein